jgi:hypothetical protein
MLDLTVYLVGPTELELEYLIDLYETICPADRRTKYTIAEFNYWDDIAHPDLAEWSGSGGGRRSPTVP